MRRFLIASAIATIAIPIFGTMPTFAMCDPGRAFLNHSTDYYIRMDVNSTDFVGTQATMDIQIPFVEPGGWTTTTRLRLWGKEGDPENGSIQAFVALELHPA